VTQGRQALFLGENNSEILVNNLNYKGLSSNQKTMIAGIIGERNLKLLEMMLDSNPNQRKLSLFIQQNDLNLNSNIIPRM
jgi:hypothetical protein